MRESITDGLPIAATRRVQPDGMRRGLDVVRGSQYRCWRAETVDETAVTKQTQLIQSPPAEQAAGTRCANCV
jgi:hypothetical protein